MKKKYLAYAALPTLVLGLFGTGIASAHGPFGFAHGGWFGGFGSLTQDEFASRQQAMFERQAQILGLGVDEVKNAWAEGKTMRQIIEEKGISLDQIQARMKEARLAELKSNLQTLVGKGVITQVQADKRLAAVQSAAQNGFGSMRRMGGGFFHGF